jgi:hypothetical protein
MSIYEFNLKDLFPDALPRLKRGCGFEDGGDPRRRMPGEALAIHDAWAAGVRIMAVAEFYPAVDLRGSFWRIGGLSLGCGAFARMDAESLCGAAVFAIALRPAGREGAEESLTRAFYEDVWGNAYVEAGMLALKSRLADGLLERAPAGAALSDAFGPGYYGMDISEMKTIARLLDFGSIGAHVTESGAIRPPKACAGLYFASTAPERLPDASCRQCAGDTKGCAFCAVSL